MADQDEKVSPLLSLLAELEQGIHLRRRDVLGRVARVQEALSRYGRALEEEAAVEFAKGHGLKVPKGAGVSSRKAAGELLAVVQSLPELAVELEQPTDAPKVERSEVPEPLAEAAPPGATERSGSRPLSAVLPRVARAALHKKLVIVGALSGRRKPLPPPLDQATEWIDTSGGGRSTQGVPARIKRGGLLAVVICDQSVSHQHSEPLVNAARAAGVPVGFAGKGGAAAIARALEAIEEQLTE